jgi:formamidopyrimidine-DNA glycosylase
MRRFARVRLVDCDASQIRHVTPLKENGPDPVIDKDIVTVAWLKEKCNAKKVPIKAMLLDQANISGIGNWVGDEVMYNAKMHPEQYANTLSDDQINQLHKSIHYVCSTAVDLLAESDKFPDDWLFKHRWGKGKKNASNTLPNGEKIAFLTVGGRTSAVVPSIQKKTGPVAKEMSEAEVVDGEDEPKKAKGKKRKAVADEDGEEEEVKPKRAAPKGKKATVKVEEHDEVEADVGSGRKQVNGTKKAKKEHAVKEEEPANTKGKATGRGKAAESKAAAKVAANDGGRRRSGRLSRG